MIDEVSIFSSALSSDQLLQLYNSAFYYPSDTSTPVIGIRPLGSQVQIMWGFGSLQSADDPSGPFTMVAPQPASPYTFPPTEVRKFYRVKR